MQDDMNPIEYTSREKALFAALPRESELNQLEEQRLVHALRSEGYFRRPQSSFGWKWQAAAAVMLFAADRNALTATDFTRLFLLASIPSLGAVLVVSFLLREAKRPERTPASTPDIGSDETAAPIRLSVRGFDGNFKGFLVIIALFTLSNSSDFFLLLRAQDAGVPVLYTTLLWAALHASKVLSSIFGGDLSDRLGRKRLIVSGWILYAAVYAGFAFVSNAISVWILFLIYGIYFGLAEGAEKALVADLVRPEQRGTAYGLYNLAFGITVLPASLMMGALWDWRGPKTAFLVSATLGATAALLLLMFVRTRTGAKPLSDLA